MAKVSAGLNISCIFSFYFEITIDLHVSVRSSIGRTCVCSAICRNGNILHNCSRIPQSGYWHLYSQDTGQFYYHKGLPCCLFIATPIFLLVPPSLALGNHWYVVHFFNFIILRRLYKCNHIVYNSILLWRIVQAIVGINSLFLFAAE